MIIEEVIRGRDFHNQTQFIEAVVERLKAIRDVRKVEVVIRRVHDR
jgi:hypothetical protein